MQSLDGDFMNKKIDIKRQVELQLREPDKCFYVYIHRRCTDNEIFYVGKGKGRRAWYSSGRSSHWLNIVNKHGFSVEIIADNLSEKDSFSTETDLILKYRELSHPLCNHTDGGEGLSGFKWSEEQMKNHPSHKNKGRKRTPEQIATLSEARRGHVVSQQTKDNLKKAFIGKRVFSHIAITLQGGLIISYKKRAEILNVEPSSLVKNPESYGLVPRWGIESSADKRRGKPTWNAGKKLPQFSGNNNSSSDKSIYSFKRVSDGLLFTGTRYDLVAEFNLNIKQLAKLFYKKPRKIAQGWSLIKEHNGTT